MNIDISSIPGYAEMTAEEKVKALEEYSFELPKVDSAETDKLKQAVSKANAEAAEWKRKHNALLSDDEKKRQESQEAFEKMEQELTALRKEKVIAEHKAKFLSLGYEESLAVETASALADGDLNKVFANMAAFQETHDKAVLAQNLKSTPVPPAGTSTVDTKSAYDKKIAEAQQRGDMAAVAAYMRLKAEEQK
jgi:hypothetical protein